MSQSSSNYLVYQAHTLRALYLETIYSIYSFGLRNDLSQTAIILYTDNPEFFTPYLSHLQVHYRLMPAEQVARWKGDIQFIHRVKIEVLLDASNNFSGNFLYLDSDTYLTEDISDIFNAISKGKLYMHAYENTLSQVRMYRPLIGYTLTIDNERYTFDKDIRVWNAGVLGFNSDHVYLLDKVLHTTDVLYGYYQKHIIEQFAFSFWFGQQSEIQSSERPVFHYWYIKEFRDHLDVIFTSELSKDPAKLSRIVRAINPMAYSERKLKWRNNGGTMRAIKRMIGKDFKLDPLPDLEALTSGNP